MAAPTETKPSQDLEQMPRINAWKQFLDAEGIPIYRGFAIEDVKALELAPWARRGGKGAYIDLDGNGQTNNAYVAEIPPGGSLETGRQMYEEQIFVIEGNGATSVWYDEDHKLSFEWKTGSLFSIPLNAWHQHHNGHGSRPARLLAVTSAPTMVNLFHNMDFIYNCDFAFRDRFAGQEHYFDGKGKMYQRRTLETNFVPDCYNVELHSWKERGAGGRNVLFEMAHNTMAAHISEFPVGTYKKAHRHGPGAHVIVLSGKGYSLLWPQGGEIRQADWGPGSIVVPPNAWFHQHFNRGAEPARYLALRWGSQRYQTGGVFSNDTPVDVDVSQGGSQIDYENEDRAIHQRFEGFLHEAGATCRMRSMVEWCSGPMEDAQKPE